MSNQGWISIHRQMQNHWLWNEKRIFSKAEAWIDILMSVNHAKAKVVIKNKVFNVERGESLMSLESWSKRWNWNKSKVRRFLELIKKDGMIEFKNESITTRLTVCNYDSYQVSRNGDETEMKRKRNGDETEMKPNNNDNNKNNENNDDKLTEFKNSLNPFLELYGSDMLNNFYNYWTEKGDKARKYRFEKEKTWEVSKRLQRWSSNNFNNTNNLKSENNEQLKQITSITRELYPDL